jgi:hypothetical protein
MQINMIVCSNKGNKERNPSHTQIDTKIYRGETQQTKRFINQLKVDYSAFINLGAKFTTYKRLG